MTVKGTKSRRMMVVPYRPWFNAGIGALWMATLAVAGGGAYWFGHHQGVEMQEEAVLERDRLRLTVQEKERDNEGLRQQVANLSLSAEVDKASSEDVRTQVITLQEQITGLQEDIAFYRGLMEPTDNRRGLTIGSVNVVSTGIPRQYEYKVVVQQLATNHEQLVGSLNMNIIGREGELERSIPLMDLSEDVDSTDIRLGFRYFQNIEGRLQLPEGFEPTRIELQARSTGRNAVSVEKKFGWLVEEITAL